MDRRGRRQCWRALAGRCDHVEAPRRAVEGEPTCATFQLSHERRHRLLDSRHLLGRVRTPRPVGGAHNFGERGDLLIESPECTELVLQLGPALLVGREEQQRPQLLLFIDLRRLWRARRRPGLTTELKELLEPV